MSGLATTSTGKTDWAQIKKMLPKNPLKKESEFKREAKKALVENDTFEFQEPATPEYEAPTVV